MGNKLAKTLRAFFVATARVAISALTWFALLSVGGFALIVAAIFVLAGFGWALLASGIALLLFAGFVMKGLSHG